MDYATARSYIRTGDLVAVRSVHSWLGRLTQLVTRSPYTHAGLAIWLEDGLYMAEINGGRNHLVPMSQLTDFDVYDPPVGLSDLKTAILAMLRLPIDYGVIAFIMIGLLNLLHLQVFIHWRRLLVCSGYCVATYEQAGWPEHSRIISPAELAKLLKLKAEVRSIA